MAPDGWSRRTKAVLFVLVLLVGEVTALLMAVGILPVVPGQGPVWYDAFWVAVAFSILAVCDLLAAYMTFYVKVTPSPTKH